ncbi:MAG: hypothetical protein CVT96_10540 [Bacteroidetes bacterium HGW-Bacteroidetes-13]|nr:MAG: hypothetical protein CVT96_10540 [Bacteroidetes bacterium HGW-Bacteroidetes-13]
MLLVTCYLLLVTCYLLLVTCYLLLVTCYLLLVSLPAGRRVFTCQKSLFMASIPTSELSQQFILFF